LLPGFGFAFTRQDPEGAWKNMPKENARVLSRMGARQLTMEEVQQVNGGATRTFRITGHPPILDAIPDFDG
jgi:hypothetical protein